MFTYAKLLRWVGPSAFVSFSDLNNVRNLILVFLDTGARTSAIPPAPSLTAGSPLTFLTPTMHDLTRFILIRQRFFRRWRRRKLALAKARKKIVDTTLSFWLLVMAALSSIPLSSPSSTYEAVPPILTLCATCATDLLMVYGISTRAYGSISHRLHGLFLPVLSSTLMGSIHQKRKTSHATHRQFTIIIVGAGPGSTAVGEDPSFVTIRYL